MNDDFKKADKYLEKLTKQQEKELLKAYKASLNNIRRLIGQAYEKYNGDFNEMQKYNRLKNLEKAIFDEISKLNKETARAIKNGVAESYAESFYYSAFAVEKGAQAKLGFSLLDNKTVVNAIKNPLDRYGAGERKDSLGFLMRHADNQNRLAQQIRDQLTQNLVQGNSYQKAARAVKERIDVGASSALRIVQTENHRVQQKGRFDSLKHAENKGVKMKKVWVSAMDGNTRDTHRDLDGQKVDLDGYFVNENGDKADYPGNFGIPSEDINCRCSTRGEIEGYEPQVRRVRGEGVIPQTSYSEWKKERLKGR